MGEQQDSVPDHRFVNHLETLAGDFGSNIRELECSFEELERKVVEQRIVMEGLEEERRTLQNKIDDFICKIQNPTPSMKRRSFFIRRKRIPSCSSTDDQVEPPSSLKDRPQVSPQSE